ncbi:glycosyltransferase [Methylosinus sp. H3A]|uniref:glycosyltransferase n=1 Tax=Methylosinus sp. H3A TaxID=2785786 RepID=UPI0018C1E42D|nr:glycosyltransferase [Methylosinus sp. H3A]MBG0812479.1 glycosyltransferase [Methylosinus sp. H3A]
MSATRNYLLVEIEFKKTVQLSAYRHDDDSRVLAVCFEKINIYCASSRECLGRFNLCETASSGWEPIYGFSGVESWGVWSIGPRAAFCLSLNAPPSGRIKVEIPHHLTDQLPIVPAEVRVNKGMPRSIDFEGGALTFDVEPWEIPIEQSAGRNSSLAGENNPILSVLIMNYNRPRLTFASVMSVLSADIGIAYEIIVVDNGSEASLARALADMRLPVRLIMLSERRSFGSANNIAIESARGEFVLFLNNDAFVEKGVVESLLSELSDENVGLVGPVYRFPDDSCQEIGRFVCLDGHTYAPLSTGFMWDILDNIDVDHISAACVVVRRWDMLNIGGFDPEFEVAYYEDVDLCLRLKALGKSTRLVTSAVVRHICGATTNSPEGVVERYRAAQRNLHVFRSRWGRWLLTRDKLDSPSCEFFDLKQFGQQIEKFADERLHCVVLDDPLVSGANAGAAFAHASALSALRPTMVASAAPHSVMDVAKKVCALGLPHDRLTGGGVADAGTRDIDVVVLSSAALPSAPPSFGLRRVLHCPFPSVSQSTNIEASKRRIGALLNFDAVVTDSEFSRRALSSMLEALGAPPIDIEVIAPPVDVFSAGELTNERSNLIVCSGALRTGPSGGRHRSVANALRRLGGAALTRRWRLVIVGDLAPDDDPGYVDEIRSWSWPLDVDILVSPSRAVLRRLLSKAKICVSARGLGVELPKDAWMCSSSSAMIGTTISAGCAPVVFDVGAEAELCEAEGVGFRFHDENQLVSALEQAIDLSGSNGLPLASRQRMDAYSAESHRSAWSKLISRLSSANEELRGVRKMGLPTAIVVAGCHRSGTSAMARVLSLAGADLPSDLMPSQADNPTGFWEPTAIADWNEELLRSRNSGWDDPRAFFSRKRLEQLTEGEKREAVDRIKSCYRGNRPIIVKDPRISIMAPLWESALRATGYEPRYVVMVRNPLEVSASLSKRNGFSKEKGLLIWANYMLAVERDTRDSSRIFVSYSDLIADPEAVIDRIQTQLAIDFVRGPSAKRSMSAFVDPGLRHQKFEDAWRGKLTEIIYEYFLQLEAASQDRPLSPTVCRDLEVWLEEVRELLDGFGTGSAPR